MYMPAQRLSRRLERTLIAFCLLAALFGVVVYITTPSIYINMLFLQPSPTDRYPIYRHHSMWAMGKKNTRL